LLPQTASEAVWLAERVRTAVEIASYPVEQQTTRLTVSVGIASLSEDTTDLAALLKEADVALYRAKQAGRNRVELSAAAEEDALGSRPDEQPFKSRSAA